MVAAAVAPVKFRNVAREAGVEFVLENTPTPEKQMIETMAGGVAVFRSSRSAAGGTVSELLAWSSSAGF